jgi:Icc-related predicted phosphoesterase
MNITFISDTHSQHNKFNHTLKGGDVIVHSGDLSNRGYLSEIKSFLQWFNGLPYTHKIFIAGNHDFLFEDNKQLCKDLMTEYSGINYLENSEVIIDGLKFYGSPYTPRFFDWAFNVDRGEKIREHWLQIPLDTDVLITHGPPHGILDYTLGSHKYAGCEDLKDVILSQLTLKAHVFGHIHEGYGVNVVGNTTFINASLVDHKYNPVNIPITIEINGNFIRNSEEVSSEKI